jgi:hypothetical protein
MRRSIAFLATALALIAAVTAASASGDPSVPVARCPTTLGVPQRLPAPPSALRVAVSSAQAARLEGYSNGYLTVLAPRGWRCRGAVGADGSGSLFVTPTGASRPAQPAVTLEYGATPGVSADLACSLFPAARRQLAIGSCPLDHPARELVGALDATTVTFEDPPGVHGAGLPSGGSDPANGVMTFTPSNRHVDGYSLTETCTLPASAMARCTAILDNIFGRARG